MVTSVEVPELKNRLSRYLELVRAGEDVVVTDRGNPIVRITSIDGSTVGLSELIAAGIVTPPRTPGRHLPRRIQATETVSDLVVQQRR